MSVGGVIISIVKKGDKATIGVAERKSWSKKNPGDLDFTNASSVVVDHGDHPIELGDMLWWQSGEAYWTPFDVRWKFKEGKSDVTLKRHGYSGGFNAVCAASYNPERDRFRALGKTYPFDERETP